MLDHQLARPRTFAVAQENDRSAPARHHRRTIMTGVHSRTLTQACYGLPLGSRWLGSTMLCILATTVAVGHAYRAIRNASYLGSQCPRTGRPRVLEHQSPTTQLSMRLQPGVHRARYGCRRHAWAVCSVAGASFAHSTHQIFRTLKCARDMSPLDQGEIELARARRDATVLPRPRPSQHEPAACGGGRRGDRSRRHRDPGRSDCCDDFTRSPHVGTASV